jgi:hypothetical protein
MVDTLTRGYAARAAADKAAGGLAAARSAALGRLALKTVLKGRGRKMPGLYARQPIAGPRQYLRTVNGKRRHLLIAGLLADRSAVICLVTRVLHWSPERIKRRQR